MKIFTNKKVTQKIIIALIIIIVFNFSVPIQSNAGLISTFADIGGDLLKELVQLVASVGDVVMGALNHFMLGTSQIIVSSMLDKNDPNITDSSAGSDLYADSLDSSRDVKGPIPDDYEFDGLIFSDGWKIPNFLYCPENIFANKIAMLDVNFINPHKYSAVEYEYDGKTTGNATESSADMAQSGVEYTSENASAGQTLREVISSWYKAFRNLAIVGLLIVLVYLGIRIMISSTAADKSKYKQSLTDWLVALCLVVVIHYIMAGIMMFVDIFTEALSSSNKGIYMEVKDSSGTNENADGDKVVSFRTNLTGYIRFMAQSKDFGYCTSYTIIYLALVIYTCMFTVTYFKRFLYMAFFTMIAPLVALSYPIDKLRDGKAQAFDLWFKEYTLNAIIQPVHFILYTVFVGSAMDLVVANPIYAIVAVGFLLPAEKFIKKMFGFDKAQTTGGLGEIAGGALAMKGVSKLVGQITGKKEKGGGKDGNSGVGNNALPIRGANKGTPNPYAVISGGTTTNNGIPAPERPAPETPAPETPAPETPAPETPVPETPAPERPAPETTAPAPETTVPETTVPETTAPETTAPETTTPETTTSETTTSGTTTSGTTASGTTTSGTTASETNETDAPILEPGATDPTRWQRVKDWGKTRVDHARKGTGALVSAGGRKIKRAAKEAVAPKKVFKTISKVGGAAAGAALIGTAAVAAGVATGDLSKGASVALGGLTLGASAGSSIGDRYGEKMSSVISDARQTYREGAYTEEELKKKKQEKHDKRWKEQEENYKYLRSKGMNSKQAKEFLNSDRTQAFLDAGITDIKLIHKAGNLADTQGYDTQQAVARAKLASGLSDDFATNDSAKNSFVKTASRHISDSNIVKQLEEDMVKLKE